MKQALRKLIDRFQKDQRGTAFIELAVVLPVLLTICLGVFEFGNAIYGRHLIENGVRDGARYAAGLPHDDATAIANAKNIAVTGVTSSGTNRVSWWNPFGASPKLCNGSGNGPGVGTVTVTYTPTPDNGTICGLAGSLAYCRGRDVSGNIYTVTVIADVPYQGLGFLTYLKLGNLCMHAEHKERLFGVR